MMKRSGMAIVIVLVFTLALLTLGSAYLKTVGHMAAVNPKSLQLMQVEYFARGIMKIALLKFKKFPADFYHAYLQEVARAKGKAVQTYAPSPIESFKGPADSILQGTETPNQMVTGMVGGSTTPVKSYTTEFRLTSQNQYNLDVLEIKVHITLKDDRTVDYKGVYNASRTRVL